MPYIPKERRKRFEPHILNLTMRVRTPGDMAYIFTQLILDYIGTDYSYTKFSTLVGVLETVKMELYRVIVSPYEDTKIEENGPLNKTYGVNSE